MRTKVSRLFLTKLDDKPKAPNHAKPFFFSSRNYLPSICVKSNRPFMPDRFSSPHSIRLLRLKNRKVNLSKKFFEKAGIVEMLSTLYMRLRFQKLIMLIRKYEAKVVLSIV